MDESTITDASRHAARASLYAFLAGAFTFPDEEVLAELTAADTARGIRRAAAELGMLEAADAAHSAFAGADVDELEAAYHDLFGIPSDDGAYAVPPYESHYTVGDDVGQQQRRVATVVGLLDAVGLERSEAFDERHDHVVVEFELMQVLAAQHSLAVDDSVTGDGVPDRKAADRLVTVEATVLDEHLVGFVPAFAHEVRDATDEPAYAAAAKLASRLVRDDHAAFESEQPTLPTGEASEVVS